MLKKFFSVIITAVILVTMFSSCTQVVKLDLKTAPVNFGDDFYCIAFRKGETALCGQVQNALQQLVDNGKAAEISNKWFGTNIVIFDQEQASACVDEDNTTASWDYIVSKGKLVIGLDDTFAPMGYRDTEGNLIGFDVDLATETGKVLNIEIEFKPIAWEAKETELSEKKIDCIWNGLSRTSDREESMQLSQNYLSNRLVIMGNEAANITSLDDLKNYTIGIQADSSSLDAVKKSEVYDSIKDKIRTYPSYDEVILDMKTGRVDVMIVDETLGNYKIANLEKQADSE